MEIAKPNTLILVALLTAGLGAINFQSLGDIVQSADLVPADRQLVDKRAGELAPAPKSWHQMTDRSTKAGLNPKPGVPLVLQSNTSNCGLASLAMLLSYHLETPVSLASLENTATTLLNASSQKWKDEGYSVGELQSLARVYGLSIRAKRVGVAELPSLSFPLLAWIDFGSNGHFTVVQSFERGEASLADPTRGYLILGKAMWERLWLKGATGIVLYVE